MVGSIPILVRKNWRKNAKSSRFRRTKSKTSTMRKRALVQTMANTIYRPTAGFKTKYGFPPKMHIQLRYADRVTWSSGVAVNGYQWKINSLFDVDLTGSGHQPMFRDNLAALYQFYNVTGVKLKMRFSSTSNSMLSIRATDEASGVPTNLSLEGERPGGQLYALSADRITTITRYFDIATVLGLSKQQYSNDYEYQAAMGADPAQLCYLNIASQNFDLSTTTVVAVWLDFTFYVSCYDLIQNQAQN